MDALEKNEFSNFLKLFRESANSSFKWLQNIYSSKNVREQGMTLVMALTENFISDIGEGACRVHGGGFAGTVQVLLPTTSVVPYIELMETVLGPGKVLNLRIRHFGTLYLNHFLNRQ